MPSIRHYPNFFNNFFLFFFVIKHCNINFHRHPKLKFNWISIFLFSLYRPVYVWHAIFGSWNQYFRIAWDIIWMVCQQSICIHFTIWIWISSYWKSRICVHNCFGYHWTISRHRTPFATFQRQKISSLCANHCNSRLQYSKILWTRTKGKNNYF